MKFIIEHQSKRRIRLKVPGRDMSCFEADAKKFCDPQYTKTWDSKKKEDPSKGFHFVEWATVAR